MTAQEWLETAEKVVADCDRSKLSFQIVCNAAAIIRAQQDRIEMLERAVESVLDVVSDDYCPTTKKCPEYGKLVRNCRAHWREYLMGGQ